MSNFDLQFTSMPPVDSPSDLAPLSESARDMFKGFSYMAPSVLLDGVSLSPQRSGTSVSSPPVHMLSLSPAVGRRRPRRQASGDATAAVR